MQDTYDLYLEWATCRKQIWELIPFLLREKGPRSCGGLDQVISGRCLYRLAELDVAFDVKVIDDCRAACLVETTGGVRPGILGGELHVIADV